MASTVKRSRALPGCGSRAASTVHHDGLVEVSDFGVTDAGLYYLVMEFVEGDSVEKKLARGPLPLDEAMEIATDAARALVEEKDTVRDVEQGLQRAHLARLQQGLSESIETSNLHQETLRALKQVNSAFTMLAYPILSETGDLLASRLSRPKP